MRQKYPCDITREQFEPILPILESARKTTKPRTMDLYDVFCAVLYLLKSGCQWRMIPKDFPKWRTVHSYFQQWSEPRIDEPKKIRLVKPGRNRGDRRKRALSLSMPRALRIPLMRWIKASWIKAMMQERKYLELNDTSL